MFFMLLMATGKGLCYLKRRSTGETPSPVCNPRVRVTFITRTTHHVYGVYVSVILIFFSLCVLLPFRLLFYAGIKGKVIYVM